MADNPVNLHFFTIPLGLCRRTGRWVSSKHPTVSTDWQIYSLLCSALCLSLSLSISIEICDIIFLLLILLFCRLLTLGPYLPRQFRRRRHTHKKPNFSSIVPLPSSRSNFLCESARRIRLVSSYYQLPVFARMPVNNSKSAWPFLPWEDRKPLPKMTSLPETSLWKVGESIIGRHHLWYFYRQVTNMIVLMQAHGFWMLIRQKYSIT